jgi:hypothetical protein
VFSHTPRTYHVAMCRPCVPFDSSHFFIEGTIKPASFSGTPCTSWPDPQVACSAGEWTKGVQWRFLLKGCGLH